MNGFDGCSQLLKRLEELTVRQQHELNTLRLQLNMEIQRTTEELRLAQAKIDTLAQYVYTDEGTFTFPDGETINTKQGNYEVLVRELDELQTNILTCERLGQSHGLECLLFAFVLPHAFRIVNGPRSK